MLVAEGLRKRYRAREVVHDFGLTLDAGEVVGLLGPNGAGSGRVKMRIMPKHGAPATTPAPAPTPAPATETTPSTTTP